MKKWVLSRHDSLELITRLEQALNLDLGLSRSSQVSCEEPEDGVVFLHIGDGLTFVQAGEKFVPFLGSPQSLAMFAQATVDKGAIKFLLNGADVMRPGVKTFSEWGEAGRLVIVKEEEKGRPITVGEATVSSSEMASLSKGICLKNLHHVGDRFWNLYKTV